jgi:hypothetical protein
MLELGNLYFRGEKSCKKLNGTSKSKIFGTH